MVSILENSSKDFRKFFLLTFTKELIKNSSPKLKEKIEENTKIILKKPEQKTITTPIEYASSQIQKNIPKQPKRIKPQFKPLPRPSSYQQSRVNIPPARLPSHLKNIRPVPRKKEIDLGKLNPLIRNPVIRSIECDGPEEKLIINNPGERKINLSLTKEEINNIIKKFAESANIPINEEGVFRVAVGKLVLSAIISKVVGSKFIIKKIRNPTPPRPMRQRYFPPKKQNMSQQNPNSGPMPNKINPNDKNQIIPRKRF